MVIRPQHFQQQDRYFDALLQGRCEALRPYGWGITSLTLNQGALQMGKIAIDRARGVLPDGTPFSIPDLDPAPTPMDVDPQFRDGRIFLALPYVNPEDLEVARNGQAGVVRFQAEDFQVRDSVEKPGTRDPELIEVGRRRLRLISEANERGGHATIGLIRVVERRADGVVILDQEYIPPCLDCAGDPVLRGILGEVEGRLRQLSAELAVRTRVPGARTFETGDFLRLQVINRNLPLFIHLGRMQNLHPETLFRDCLQLAGELATFFRKDKRPADFPPYLHDDLKGSFFPILEELRVYLSPGQSSAIQLPLEKVKDNVYISRIKEPQLLKSARHYLIVNAKTPGEELRGDFPNLLKISPAEKLQEFIRGMSAGIPIKPIQTVPQQLPIYEGHIYFELDRSSDFWVELGNSKAFGFHLGQVFPGLEMSFWAVPELRDEVSA